MFRSDGKSPVGEQEDSREFNIRLLAAQGNQSDARHDSVRGNGPNRKLAIAGEGRLPKFHFLDRRILLVLGTMQTKTAAEKSRHDAAQSNKRTAGTGTFQQRLCRISGAQMRSYE